MFIINQFLIHKASDIVIPSADTDWAIILWHVHHGEKKIKAFIVWWRNMYGATQEF